jgi:hypothetical protein
MCSSATEVTSAAAWGRLGATTTSAITRPRIGRCRARSAIAGLASARISASAVRRAPHDWLTHIELRPRRSSPVAIRVAARLGARTGSRPIPIPATAAVARLTSRHFTSRRRIERTESAAILSGSRLACSTLQLWPRSTGVSARGAVVLGWRIKWSEATTVLSRSGLTGPALRLRSGCIAIADGAVVSARRRKRPEAATALDGSRLACAALRLRSGCVVVATERPISTSLRILIRHIPVAETPCLPIRYSRTWPLHGPNCARTTSG